MALAHAAAPEGVVAALGQDHVAEQALQREQAGIPAARDQAHMAAFLRRGIDGGEVLRDVVVGVEAVHDVAEPGVARGLLGQVRRAAAAQDQHVDVVGGARLKLACIANRHALGGDGHRGGVAAREHRGELRVRILADGQLHAAPDVAVAQDADANCRHAKPFLFE